MRWWVCGLLIAMACPALAADYDDSWLRGSQVIGPAPAPPSRLYRIWAGVYGGAQVGEDFHGVGFDGVPLTPVGSAISQDAILQILQNPLNNMLTFPRVNAKGPSFGGFVGYNWQIDDVVFGVELNANRAMLHATETSSATRGYFVTYQAVPYAVTLSATSVGTIDMSDYITARGRLGWAFGNFLPYIVAGISFAQVDSSGYTDIKYTGINVTTACRTLPPPVPPCLPIGADYPFSNLSHGKYILGFDAAVGIDYLLTKNVFVRGEVEYLQLAEQSAIALNTVSARIAIGLKY